MTKIITQASLKVVDERIDKHFKAIEHENIYQSWLNKLTNFSHSKRVCKQLEFDTFWKLEEEHNRIVNKTSILGSSRRKIICRVYNNVVGGK
jgi:hypothetical protein